MNLTGKPDIFLKIGNGLHWLFIILVVIFFSSTISYSQSLYPEILHSNFSNGPSAVKRLDSEMKSFANFTHLRYLNLLNDVYVVSFTGFLRIASRHQVGALLFGDKEGPYIGKYRANLHYAYQIQYSENAFISMGGSAGLVSLQYDGSKSGVTSRDIVPDLGVDFLLRRKTFFISALINQLSSQQIKPLYSTINLRRFYELRSGTTIPIGLDFYLKPQAHFVWYNDPSPIIQNQYGALVLFNKGATSAGIGTYNLNTFIFHSSP